MKPWQPGQFATGVVKKLEQGVQHVEQQIRSDISDLAARIERQNKVDAFLRPLRFSRLGRTPVYSQMKALLDYRSSQGQDPEEFVSELQQQGKTYMKKHGHELSWARDLLRALRSGNNPRRLREEVFLPLKTRSISASEAWSRLDGITGVQTLSAQPPQNNPPSQGAQHSHHDHTSHHSQPPQGSTPSQPDPPSQGANHSRHDHTSHHSQPPQGSTPSQPNPPPQQSPAPPPSAQPSPYPRTPMIGGTIGVGIAGGVAAVVGAQGCFEILGCRYDLTSLYVGDEVSLGVQLGGEVDLIVEVGFMPPLEFGGGYYSINVAMGDGVGGLVQVGWPLPPVNPADPNPPPQGFAIGAGVGIDVTAAMAAGYGFVQPFS